VKSWKIHIEGQVQGVGFRPFVYRLAQAEGLLGRVSNGVDGVRMTLNANESQLKSFLTKIKNEAPRAALIVRVTCHETKWQAFQEFSIVESDEQGKTDLLLTPDLGICPKCKADLETEGGRRAGYAFTTCTNCGPRYSIINSLPYDRHRTEMADFPMCPACTEEYHSPDNRRFFSQTNSCPECAVQLHIDGDNKPCSQSEILKAVTTSWRQGKIVALKGIGGFLLTCDASNVKAIKTLRSRKYRPDKPLAVMFGSTGEVAKHFKLSKEESEALESLNAPIVLLSDKIGANELPLAREAIAPGLDRVGIMLPCAPLFDLLLKAFGGPIIATSGNLSGEPIVYQDREAGDTLGSVADLIITNNREVLVPQDDSVVAFSHHQRPVFLRRSRGYAPTYVHTNDDLPETDILATGADLKSVFALQHGNNTYLSQYLGDLGSYSSQQNYQRTLSHLQQLLQAVPSLVLADLHPDYAASQLAEAYATANKLPLVRVQHHEAHFAAVLLENNLLEVRNTPVLGIIWDGTGYGSDGQIWGGESFVFEAGTFTRVGQLAYYPHFAGDKLAKEPRLAALAIAGDLPIARTAVEEKFTPPEYRIYQQLRTSAKRGCSSMGRLFDAVASLLGCCDQQSYEGMAASRLETMARKGLADAQLLGGYAVCLNRSGNFAAETIIKAILEDENRTEIKAARFHLTLVSLVEQSALKWGTKEIAFSGGVFQNILLVELLTEILSKSYQIHFQKFVSPNDECVALGQLAHYTIRQRVENHKKEQHVFSYTG
jgi:hydrogenase maturation protein HypF